MLESDSLKAVVLKKTCKASELTVSEVPIPEVKPDWVLVKIIGFGINRAEVILRDYEADEDYINLPVIPGILNPPSPEGFIIAVVGILGQDPDTDSALPAQKPGAEIASVFRNGIHQAAVLQLVLRRQNFFVIDPGMSRLNASASLFGDDELRVWSLCLHIVSLFSPAHRNA